MHSFNLVLKPLLHESVGSNVALVQTQPSPLRSFLLSLQIHLMLGTFLSVSTVT